MELCSDYVEVNKFLINVIGDFEKNYIIVYIPRGSNYEKISERGLNHVCEHILLKEIEKEYLNYCSDENFDYKGHTDYTNVVLEFSIGKIEFIDVFFCAINNVRRKITHRNIDQIIIEISKREVLNECKIKKYLNEQINTFLSQGEINWLPIGKSEDINNFSDQMIMDCLQHYLLYMRIIVLSKNKILNYDISSFPSITKSNPNLYRNKGIYNKSGVLENRTNIYVKLYKNRCDKDFIAENILENILVHRLCYIKKIELIDLKRKKLHDQYYFFQLCLKRKIQLEDLYILKKRFCLGEFEMAKKEVCFAMKNINTINYAYVISNLLNHFNYGDSIMLTHKYIDYLVMILENYEFDQFEKSLLGIYSNNIFVVD